MEPMTLGSPVGSPSSIHPPNSPYLPSFLMGDMNCSNASHKSPSRTREAVVSPIPSTPIHTTDKASNGPPTRGLFDEPFSFQSPHIQAANSSLSNNTTHAGNWVTVFGFPPSSASVILLQFSNYGTIVDSRSAHQGNWVHIQYQSKAEARRALSNNAKVFGNSIMVGVVMCTDQDILNEGHEKENTSILSSPGFASPYGTPNRPRPLTQAYRNAQQSSEVLTRNTPHKSTSIVTKAWEFLGW